MTRTAVLGLDALPYWYIGKLERWGRAPNLSSLLERAARLECIPPITSSSWPSIMTGVNPGKHGLYSFHHVDRATRERRLSTAWDLEHPRVHEMLAFSGVKNIMVNPIPDYPIIPVRGSVIVSNLFFTPRPGSWPPGFYDRYFKGIDCRKVEEYQECMEAYVGALIEIVENESEYGFVWLNINFPDHEFHRNPRLLHDPGVAHRVWDAVDRLVRRLLDLYDNVFLVSDHGFRWFEYKVSVNDILYENGFVEIADKDEEAPLEEELARQAGIGARRVTVPRTVYKLVARLGLEPQARRVFRWIARAYTRLTGKRLVARTGLPIDYARSRAYMPESGMYGVYIFDKTVEREEIISILKKYEGLRVWDSREVYNGPYLERGPDVVVVGDHERGYVLGPARIVGSVYTRTRFHSHDLWGVLAARTESGELEEAIAGRTFRNTIVAPLILCSHGVPVSSLSDDLELVGSICPGDVRIADYVGRFRLLKRIALARRKLPGRRTTD